ncbi:MAG: glycogen debranching enzyme N-terminal domain-containing protein [Polyangiaceae bacterium]|nr:glycogen debranching enzyme N-terminal domain-containing protein [Polyangiaceae bacterium]
MTSAPARPREWLEPDGLGGFASGTTELFRTRRYHGLLVAAASPPADRRMLVSGLEAWLTTARGRRALSAQRYAPGVVFPDGASRLESFAAEPWPTFTFDVDGLRLEHELFMVHGAPLVVLSWSAARSAPLARDAPVTLEVRPLLAGRDFHALMRENGAFRFEPERRGERLEFRPYDGVPELVVLSDGVYAHAPDWYRNFLYAEEHARGLDATEDLASPGVFTWELDQGPATLVFAMKSPEAEELLVGPARNLAARLRDRERARRGAFPSRVARAADAYLVRRGAGRTIIAGYPWFGDWGRDTFISLRGLALATGRFDDARDILVEWAGAVSEGMLPNRFPDHGEAPEYNSVDASLWYVIAVAELLRAAPGAVRPEQRGALCAAVSAILDGYTRGTRYGIRMDPRDALLRAGEPGVQLTWMDAKIGDYVVTPRIGKPVEVQALWINALAIGAELDERWRAPYERGVASFGARFWNAEQGCLFDVLEPDDAALRPNQIFAVGGLPHALLAGERARRVVERVEEALVTPLGLRSLAPGEPGYRARYEGGVFERDSAYHQGTVWPWLMGPFVEAWLRVGKSRDEARRRFLAPLRAALDAWGVGHLPEIADAEPPLTPRGCPFQAWSLGELLRIERLLAD